MQAEIEYWHEMLQLNKSRVTRTKEDEMRDCLKEAVRALNYKSKADYRLAA